MFSWPCCCRSANGKLELVLFNSDVLDDVLPVLEQLATLPLEFPTVELEAGDELPVEQRVFALLVKASPLLQRLKPVLALHELWLRVAAVPAQAPHTPAALT